MAVFEMDLGAKRGGFEAHFHFGTVIGRVARVPVENDAAEDYPESNYTMLKSNAGMGIDVAIGKASDGLGAGPTAYVAVDDVDRYLDTAREGAVTVIQEPYDIEGMGRFAVFADPEGNRIGLWTMPGA